MQILHPELTFIYGPMGSAKTAHLIISAHNCMENGLPPIIFTSALDTRCEQDFVQSRVEGIRAEAVSVSEGMSLIKILTNKSCVDGQRFRVVFCDEIQFMSPEQIDEMAEIVDDLDIPVFAYGLRADFRTDLFPASARLFSIADRIQDLQAICPCGARASVNARLLDGKIIKNGPQVMIGGNESYMAMCRKCWKKDLLP